MEINGYSYPENVYYLAGRHSWVDLGRAEEKEVSKVGVTSVGQALLGPVVRIEARPPGVKVLRDKPLAVLETEHVMGFLFSPVSCVIDSTNEALSSKLNLVNTSPYDDGWIAKVTPTNLEAELSFLQLAAEIRPFVEKTILGMARLKPGGSCCGPPDVSGI